MILIGLLYTYVAFFTCDETSGEKLVEFPPHGYAKDESGNHDGPRHVNFSLWIESVIRINPNEQEFVLNSYVIQEWMDERLARVKHHDLVLQDDSLIWTPDIYCLNCRKSALGQKGTRVLLRVGVDGQIYHSQPGLLHAACNFKFAKFPFDVQKCNVQFASYSNNNSIVQYTLEDARFLVQKELDQFFISSTVKKRAEVKKYLSGNYTVMELELTFTRQVGFYLIRLFSPASVLVCLSWMMFYVSPKEIGTRLSIGITLILSMIFLLGYSDSSLPRVSYIKAIDWFLISSLLLIVLAVMEAISMYWYLLKSDEGRENTNSISSSIDEEEIPLKQTSRVSTSDADSFNFMAVREDIEGDHSNARKRLKNPVKMRLCHRNNKKEKVVSRGNCNRLKIAARIETVAKILFPLMFVTFSVAYGMYFTSHRHE